jgi:hypothetical protein
MNTGLEHVRVYCLERSLLREQQVNEIHQPRSALAPVGNKRFPAGENNTRE